MTILIAVDFVKLQIFVTLGFFLLFEEEVDEWWFDVIILIVDDVFMVN